MSIVRQPCMLSVLISQGSECRTRKFSETKESYKIGAEKSSVVRTISPQILTANLMESGGQSFDSLAWYQSPKDQNAGKFSDIPTQLTSNVHLVIKC